MPEGNEISRFNLIPLPFLLVSIGFLRSSRTGCFTLYLPQNERTREQSLEPLLPADIEGELHVILNFIIGPLKKVAEINVNNKFYSTRYMKLLFQNVIKINILMGYYTFIIFL